MRHLAEEIHELDAFDNVSEEEITWLWRSIRSSGLSGDEALNAIVTGMALDIAFARSKHLREVEQ